MNNTNKPGTNEAGRAPKGMPTDLNHFRDGEAREAVRS